MRIIEWNCQGAFRKKNDKIISLNPEILIVLECENEERLKFGKLTPKPNDFFWYGDSKNKGIGIFSYSDYKFELLKAYNPKFRYVIPLKVTGNGENFLLFGIWTMDNKENPDARYIGQIWLAINYYTDLLNNPTLLIGDFNSNQIWDYKDRVGNHTDVVEYLQNRGISSVYHKQESVEHGQEKVSTFFMYRKREKPYHIDYCFASEKILKNNFELVLGKVDSWIELSDHVPLTIEISGKVQSERLDNSLKDFIAKKNQRLLPETKDKFSNLIEELLENAKKSDKLDSSAEHLEERKHIIDNLERLFEIDKLIRGINISKNAF